MFRFAAAIWWSSPARALSSSCHSSTFVRASSAISAPIDSDGTDTPSRVARRSALEQRENRLHHHVHRHSGEEVVPFALETILVANAYRGSRRAQGDGGRLTRRID